MEWLNTVHLPMYSKATKIAYINPQPKLGHERAIGCWYGYQVIRVRRSVMTLLGDPYIISESNVENRVGEKLRGGNQAHDSSIPILDLV